MDLIVSPNSHSNTYTSVLTFIVLIDPGTYVYNNATMQRNKEPPKNYPGQYNTDLITNKSIGFLEEAAKSDSPFFLGVMPIAPHSELIVKDGKSTFSPPVPAERYKDLYHGVKVPRTPNFNPERVRKTEIGPVFR